MRKMDCFGGESYPIDVVEDVKRRRLGRQEPRRKHEKNRARGKASFWKRRRSRRKGTGRRKCRKKGRATKEGKNDVKEGKIARKF